MNQPSNHWRQMFERDQRGGGANAPHPAPHHGAAAHRSAPLPGARVYDDGHDAALSGTPPLSPEAINDEAAMALALDAPDYRPWIIQRGRTRPSLMLHLRRYDPRSRQWSGWAVAYPHLVAVEYTGDSLLSLDFGTRQFMLEGHKLGELIDHLQSGHVLCIQEYAPALWPAPPVGARIAEIRMVGRA